MAYCNYVQTGKFAFFTRNEIVAKIDEVKLAMTKLSPGQQALASASMNGKSFGFAGGQSNKSQLDLLAEEMTELRAALAQVDPNYTFVPEDAAVACFK